MSGGWSCPVCGACWSDNFIGPCPHPKQTVTATNTATCDHEWVPSDTSLAGWVCRKCHEIKPYSYYPTFCAAAGEEP